MCENKLLDYVKTQCVLLPFVLPPSLGYLCADQLSGEGTVCSGAACCIRMTGCRSIEESVFTYGVF